MFGSNDGQEFVGSIHQKVSDNLEAAVNLAWAAGTGNTTFAIGGKYKLDSDATFSVSLDNGLTGLCVSVYAT